MEIKSGVRHPNTIIDISRIQDLKKIVSTDLVVSIGSMVTHAEIMHSSLLRDMLPSLVEAAHTIGTVQTRNMGTIGGNLMTCVPSMDSGPSLMALDAMVNIRGLNGQRQLPIADLFLGPRNASLKPDELLIDVFIPKSSLSKPTAFLKFGLRKGQALALVNVAVSFWVDWSKNIFLEPRISLGAVAPTVIRATIAEKYLEGRQITSDTIAEAGRIAVTEANPITDFRASAKYRSHLISVLTQRALSKAYDQATLKRAGDKYA